MGIYPKHILPYSQYHFIEQNKLLTQSGLVLIRHIESDKVQWIDNPNVLHPDCIQIQSDHLRDLSNNLLGVFKVDDIFYGINKEYRHSYCELWEEDTMGLIPADNECFKDENRGFYFIPIDNLLKCDLPEVGEQKCHFMIFHTPTKCNFWHISIRLLNCENKEISSLDLNDKKKKRIWKSARDFLIADIISRELKSYTAIPDYLYLKSS
ncbi:isoleucyl-tRNA synthetase [Prevotella pallens]|uniref:isoleucyl-tRNA synthetase n=1 Tax=Prevotella pallens TaxID=60133 RepID=UPI00288C614E|nr:isoleucyl-tRNA synthetase [Prevotella pallens]